jgi:Holliday junction resolvase RusA-like endonuclease
VEVRFSVEGKPVPKARARVINGRSYTPASTRDWEGLVSWSAKLAMAGRPPLEGEIAVRLHFLGAHGSADLDNLVKSMLDAMNRVVYTDDKLITQITATKKQIAKPSAAPSATVPGVSVRVFQLL